MAQFNSDFQIKKDICEIGRRMYAKGFVASNDGNISVKVGPNAIWTTPTGVSKGYMTPDMLVKVNLDGVVLEGRNKPSSEVKMHLRVYKERTDIMAVVHAHPPIATAYAIAGIPLEKALLPEAIVNLGTVPIASYATPGTNEVPDSIADYLKEYNAVLLANHGALTWGNDIYQAYFRMETLEYFGAVLLNTKLIGKANELDCDKVSALLDLRKKLGLTTGGVPPCSTEKNDPSSEDEEKDKIIKVIVEKVTESVLQRLNR